MKLTTLLRLRTAASLALILGCALTLLPGDTDKPAARPTAGRNVVTAVVDMERQVEEMVRYAMPGPHHRLLDRLVGTWSTVTRYWMKPGVEPVEANGTSGRKWVLGGRFLMEELDGGNLALPFRGMALFGYDAFEQKYTSAWADSLNTAITTNLGTYDRTNDTVNFSGEYKDPWTGSRKPERGVLRFEGEDQHALELYVREAGGEEYKMLEIRYTRKPGPAR